MKAKVPITSQKRVVVIGGGFGGLKFARKLAKYDFQVVLLDKINYHQFQPLFYQVATAGLEPSAISFPLRKVFHKQDNVVIRLAEVTSVNTKESFVVTDIGEISYDYLVVAIGADTNFFGNEKIKSNSLPMKSTVEALNIRNRILQNYEEALSIEDAADQQAHMNIVVVGGGPTGVEVAGTLAEMRKNILPKDFPELKFERMQIYLLEASPKLLNGLSQKSSEKSKEYLDKLGVNVRLETRVKDYDGNTVFLENSQIQARTLIWAAGVIGNKLEGIPADVLVRGNRIKVDRFNKMEGSENVFALGDVCFMTEEKFPNGHPQVAQVAMQQAENLARNLGGILKNEDMKPFTYRDLGSMATVGRNLAVVDFPFMKIQGFFAWLIWMFVHLMSIVGAKNRVLIFINWAWNYITYDQSLRLIIKDPKKKK
ncbi:MAG: NAD(P)/FAD-dependent oxidoreductase [Bacteroidetes bacterium]|nr:NAD(P)/FAD-dependent oxidoreductase [Bacteroidota bacterium]